MKKKIALVTGGSRGLGKNTAIKLALKGLDVIITYHTKKDEASQVVEEIKKAGGEAAALQLNIGDVRSFGPFFEQVAEVLKVVFNTDCFDYLINNAGIGMNIPFIDTTEEQFNQLMNVQFKGVYFFTQKALNYLNDGGGIINISSRLAQASMPGYSAYASMKGAIETLTRYQAKELSSRGIKVNTVAPGPIATDFAGGIIRDNAQYNANIKAATALGRVGEPDDIGGVVAFLCTEDARWITAQRIEVSGGMNL
ncbi:SDR family oxidoreductase [Geosporobacter ferrireducens]|uniref:Short-chain dehydrogenase n=1 Tax=Geosporobacter ferrireducens TaxID=1424294 RepID=A0A1D8GLT2_9FIRM|nr:SDR family oxidoreductase [Geosporobacter ferrireducens]AOT71875.1 short-chain dehydrogenase [Geosporobacter ferrireducens]MTI55663.1 SDR family oxidoreductase [Geosporobacter ferrireducens]